MKLLSTFIAFAIATPFTFGEVAFLPLNSKKAIANAQENSECFMLDASGKPMDLGHLCGNSRNNVNTSTIKTRNSRRSNNSDVIVIPIKRREGGTPIVDVKFNDRYIFEMLFDTGATMTVITEGMASKLRVKSAGSLPFQTASNNFIFFEIGNLDSVGVDGLTNRRMNIAIAPTLDMGLLGQDFYGMFDITIKYDRIELKRR